MQQLKTKARNLIDKIGSEALPPLSTVGGENGVIAYILDVQISMLASALRLRATPQSFGAPPNFGRQDDEGYFGGDGHLAKNVQNYMDADFRKPMHMIQPAHRGLNSEDSSQVNLEEAHHGFQQARARNMGSIRLG